MVHCIIGSIAGFIAAAPIHRSHLRCRIQSRVDAGQLQQPLHALDGNTCPVPLGNPMRISSTRRPFLSLALAYALAIQGLLAGAAGLALPTSAVAGTLLFLCQNGGAPTAGLPGSQDRPADHAGGACHCPAVCLGGHCCAGGPLASFIGIPVPTGLISTARFLRGDIANDARDVSIVQRARGPPAEA